jgi:hypothetical protein
MRIRLAVAPTVFGVLALTLPSSAQQTGVTGTDAAKSGIASTPPKQPPSRKAAKKKSVAGPADKTKPATDAAAAKAMTKDPDFKARNAVIPP